MIYHTEKEEARQKALESKEVDYEHITMVSKDKKTMVKAKLDRVDYYKELGFIPSKT